ncbi:MAG TPA: hypothetical protein VNX25_08620 [Verrucomicrobiae bacterium]|nr:hypothetical protein [Verrucomicrobiae bacterium]
MDGSGNILRRIALNLAVIAAISLVLVSADVLHRQWTQFRKGERGVEAGDFAGAVAGYESAIHMYFPLSPLVSRSAERLWGIGEEFRRRGDRERALIAYRALRSSFYSAEWIFLPGRDWIRRCDERTAELTGSR